MLVLSIWFITIFTNNIYLTRFVHLLQAMRLQALPSYRISSPQTDTWSGRSLPAQIWYLMELPNKSYRLTWNAYLLSKSIMHLCFFPKWLLVGFTEGSLSSETTRRREKRDFLIMRYYEKRLRNFHSKMYRFVNRSVFIQKWTFQVSTLSGFRIMIKYMSSFFLLIVYLLWMLTR